MPDMYDKLGDLLNEALESGKINNESSAEAENIQDRDTSSENCDKSGLFYFNHTTFSGTKRKKVVKIQKNEHKQTAEIIKMHKYTKIMHIPPGVQHALTILDIAYPYTWQNIKRKYRLLLKENHPDIKNTIQTSKDVLNNRQLSIDEIKISFEILRKYYNK